jgi:hypothetical protein
MWIMGIRQRQSQLSAHQRLASMLRQHARTETIADVVHDVERTTLPGFRGIQFTKDGGKSP